MITRSLIDQLGSSTNIVLYCKSFNKTNFWPLYLATEEVNSGCGRIWSSIRAKQQVVVKKPRAWPTLSFGALQTEGQGITHHVIKNGRKKKVFWSILTC